MRSKRKDIRQAMDDAAYEAWRSGLNSDAVDYERVADSVYNGCNPNEAAREEGGRLARARQQTREEHQREEDIRLAQEGYLRGQAGEDQ